MSAKKSYLRANSPTQITIIFKKLKKLLKPLKINRKKTLFFVGCLVLLFIVWIVFLFKDVPNPTKLTRTPAPVSTQILDRQGKLLYEIYVDKNRTPVNFDQIPEYVKEATIAIEDKNFYRHHGLDLFGITRAAFKTLTGQRLEGGSTITQQLVKIALLDDPSRTVNRKIKEAVLALVTEFVYSKNQILELYLNHIPYGGTAYGIESASRVFFNKSVSELDLAESALLAGLPQAPSRYSPFGSSTEMAKNRQRQVLKRMVDEGYITNEEADKAASEELKFSSSDSSILAPHFVFWIKDQLIERYGEEIVNLGGLRVTTSLDLALQEAAQASVAAEIAKLKKLKVGNGAAIITKPRTGEVLAMVGSKDYFGENGKVNVTTSYRQPGSSIKPLNYATGLLLGQTSSTTFLDLPTCFLVSGQKPYCPKNYDGTYHGPVQLRFALGNSLNIPAVKQLAINGVEAFIATASAMGITGWDNSTDYGLSLTLGGGEVRMIDMAVAYGVFSNNGVRVPLHPILKVETYQGEILESFDPEQLADYTSSLPLSWDEFWGQNQTSSVTTTTQETEKASEPNFITKLFKRSETTPETVTLPKLTDNISVVLPEEVAFIITHILLDNNARAGAFGTNSELVIKGRTVSVKTGTTNDLRDNWTIGYTPDYLVGVWVGNNDNTPMSYIASGVTGASPIWNDITRFLLKSQPDHFPVQPKGVISAQICTSTGLLPTPENPCETRTDYFVDKVKIETTYPTRKQIWVRRDTKVPVMPGEEVIDLDLEEHTVVNDPFISDFCLDCNWSQEIVDSTKNPPEIKINYPTFNIDYTKFQKQKTPLSNPTPTSN